MVHCIDIMHTGTLELICMLAAAGRISLVEEFLIEKVQRIGTQGGEQVSKPLWQHSHILDPRRRTRGTGRLHGPEHLLCLLL
jgi:hypothetical protein